MTPTMSDPDAFVVVSEKVPLKEHKLSSLLEAVRTVFHAGRVTKLLYSAGDDLVVEKRVAKKDLPPEGDPSIVTPYQQIRGSAEIRIQEVEYPPLDSVCYAIQDLLNAGHRPTHLVVQNREAFQKWCGRGLRIVDVLRLPLLEDTDAKMDRLFVCGSRSGEMIQDIEYVICVSTES